MIFSRKKFYFKIKIKEAAINLQPLQLVLADEN